MSALPLSIARLRTTTQLGLTLGLCLWGGATWADSIREISLSTAGIAEVVRQVSIPEQGPVSLTVPLDQVDDVLKTLLISDAEQRIQSLTLAGKAPLDSSLAGLPFNESSLSSIHALASSLRGVEIQAYSQGRSVRGTLLGVDAQEQDQKTVYSLSLLSAEGQVQTVELGPDSSLQVLDSRIQAQLQQASQILARQTNDNSRELHLSLAPTKAKELELRYLIAAPIWKTTYRLLLDSENKARLQAWAVVENTTGEDWKDISLTLSSGSPVVYQQALLQQYWHTRPELPIAVGSSTAPAPDNFGASVASFAPAPIAAAKMVMREERSMDMSDRARQGRGASAGVAGGAAAIADEGQTVVRFTIPNPVNAASGQTISVPFQDQQVQAEDVSVYFQNQNSPHPSAAIYLKNTLDSSLPPGIITVFDRQLGHIGDAQLTGLPSGEARLIYFARDNKVQVHQERSSAREITQTQVANGVVLSTWKQSQLWTYNVQGAAKEARQVIIDMPRQEGWEFSSSATTEQTSQSYRLRVTVPAGETVQVQATFSRLDAEELRLDEVDESVLYNWNQGGLNATWKAAMPELVALREKQSVAAQEWQHTRALLDEQVSEQERVRENLAAVSDQSNLGQRFAQQLEVLEDRIAELRKQAQEQDEVWQAARKKFQEALSKL